MISSYTFIYSFETSLSCCVENSSLSCCVQTPGGYPTLGILSMLGSALAFPTMFHPRRTQALLQAWEIPCCPSHPSPGSTMHADTHSGLPNTGQMCQWKLPARRGSTSLPLRHCAIHLPLQALCNCSSSLCQVLPPGDSCSWYHLGSFPMFSYFQEKVMVWWTCCEEYWMKQDEEGWTDRQLDC